MQNKGREGLKCFSTHSHHNLKLFSMFLNNLREAVYLPIMRKQKVSEIPNFIALD